MKFEIFFSKCVIFSKWVATHQRLVQLDVFCDVLGSGLARILRHPSRTFSISQLTDVGKIRAFYLEKSCEIDANRDERCTNSGELKIYALKRCLVCTGLNHLGISFLSCCSYVSSSICCQGLTLPLL